VDLNYKVVNIFPSSIHSLGINNFDDYKDQLIQETYQERDEDLIGRKISNRGGWQSNQINIQECKSKTLKKIIIDSLSGFTPISENVSMVIEGWKNINAPGDFNVKHDHPRSNLSGVLWIKTPKNSGNLVFTSPQLFNKFQELYNYTDEFKYDTKSYMTYYFTPTEGRILLFPSSLEHEVEENKSDEDRISYSFNIKLINEE
tara:strand:- start:768 stop:1373 length:606 start_codon:yes stop_codon:yes gene_type:complete